MIFEELSPDDPTYRVYDQFLAWWLAR